MTSESVAPPETVGERRREEFRSSDASGGPAVNGQADVLSLPVRHLDGPFGDSQGRPQGASTLKRRLVLVDVSSVIFGWGLSLVLPFPGAVDRRDSAVLLVAATAMLLQMGAMAGMRLQKARVASRRSMELSGLGRSALAGAIWAGALARIGNLEYADERIVVGAVLSFGFLAVGRGMYTSWLRTERAHGRYQRGLVLVGTNEEAASLRELLSVHPELGYRVVAVVGDREGYDARDWSIPFVGPVDEALNAVAHHRADGVIIAVSALRGGELNQVSRELLRHDVHVHLSSGLLGIDQRRLRPLPMAHEPLFYLEAPISAPWRRVTKRVIDVTASAVALVVISPFLALAALAIKLGDRGPVLFKQERVGLNGQTFEVYKLRTMVPDAEARLDEVRQMMGNGRDGVLFKLENDPRRTKVGRVLEATSFDEIPQLFNVLNGSMSLVGPRPPLPREVEMFDDELMRRFTVRPGVTGLWQVEARENPSFSAYRRLDLFYVDNWTLTIDIILMLQTCSSILARVVRRGRASVPAEDRVAA